MQMDNFYLTHRFEVRRGAFLKHQGQDGSFHLGSTEIHAQTGPDIFLENRRKESCFPVVNLM